MDSITKQTFDYLNQIRQNPQSAINTLEEKLKYFKGDTLWLPGVQVGLRTQEGPSAIKECIAFLKKQSQLPAFKWSEGLALAAQDHTKDIGPKGICGHNGSDGSTMSQRIERHGQWSGTIGENIDFGSKTGEDIVLSLIVDDGVASRGHRTNCFNPKFLEVGIAFGPHTQYRHCCVMDFATHHTAGGNGGSQKDKSQEAPISYQNHQPTQSIQPSYNNNTETKMPDGCVKKSTQTNICTKNGKKTTTITTTYVMNDGSTRTETKTTIEG